MTKGIHGGKQRKKAKHNKAHPLPEPLDPAHQPDCQTKDSDHTKNGAHCEVDSKMQKLNWREKFLRWAQRWDCALQVIVPSIFSGLILIAILIQAAIYWKQANIMDRQGKTMQESLYVSERAYVAVKAIKFDLTKGEVTITLHNIGRNPAGDLELAAFGDVNDKENHRLTGSFKSDWGHTQIYPGSLETVAVITIEGYSTEAEDLIRAGKQTLYIRGRIDYWDGFKKATTQHFSYSYVPPPYELWINNPINTFEELQKL